LPDDVSPIAEVLAGVPGDEQVKPAPGPDPRIAGGNAARVHKFEQVRRGAADRPSMMFGAGLARW